MTETVQQNKPTPAFVGASWLALAIGISTYLIGLFNSAMELNEIGYYFTVLLLGLYGAISLQKTVRDRADGIPTTTLYYGITWFILIVAVALLVIGLWNAGSIVLVEKGFYGLGFVLSLFAVVAVQKNVRDLAGFKGAEEDELSEFDTPPNPPL